MVRVRAACAAGRELGTLASMIEIGRSERRQAISGLGVEATGHYAMPMDVNTLRHGWNGEPVADEAFNGLPPGCLFLHAASIYSGSNEIRRNIAAKHRLRLQMIRKTFPVTWDELHRDTKALAWRLNDEGPFRGIVGIARGGLVPAAIVARELELRFVDTVCIASYDDRDRRDPVVLKALEGNDGEGLLIVDDLADTGVTARIVRAMLPKAHFAAVYAKPEGRPMVDTTVTQVSQDTWIVFPWDEGVPIGIQTG